MTARHAPAELRSSWDALAAGMSERELENGVRRILKDLPEVLAYHTHDSRRSHAGYPDWTFAGPGGVLFRELKTARGPVTAGQERWLETLRAAGLDASIWRPASLLSGAVARELAGLAGMRGTR